MTLPKSIICDLDGTLADHRHRLKFVDPEFDEDACKEYEEVNKWGYPIDESKFKWFDSKGKRWHPDYDAYFAAMGDDGVNEGVQSLITSMAFDAKDHLWDFTILFVTGRPEKYRQATEKWLKKHTHFWYREKLFMRPDFLPWYKDYANISLESTTEPECSPKKTPDHRPSHIVKREIYEREIAGKYDVLFVLEDSAECVAMYRDLGLTVLQVHV